MTQKAKNDTASNRDDSTSLEERIKKEMDDLAAALDPFHVTLPERIVGILAIVFTCAALLLFVLGGHGIIGAEVEKAFPLLLLAGIFYVLCACYALFPNLVWKADMLRLKWMLDIEQEPSPSDEYIFKRKLWVYLLFGAGLILTVWFLHQAVR